MVVKEPDRMRYWFFRDVGLRCISSSNLNAKVQLNARLVLVCVARPRIIVWSLPSVTSLLSCLCRCRLCWSSPQIVGFVYANIGELESNLFA